MMEIDGIKSTVQLISNLWYQNTCVSVKKIAKLQKKKSIHPLGVF